MSSFVLVFVLALSGPGLGLIDLYESATDYFHLAVIEYLCNGRRAVPLQTFTTRHLKLSIVGFVNHLYAMCLGNYQIRLNSTK